jgi:N-acetylmuramoyl-L-alanine amidase
MTTASPAQTAGRAVAALLLVAAAGTVAMGGLAARYGHSWPRRLLHPRPAGIVIHHSASSSGEGLHPVDAALIDRWHARRGWGQTTAAGAYHIGYHYVILPDGRVQPGRPEWMPGAHTVGHNDCLGICLVGNFSTAANPTGAIKPAKPTPAQLRALEALLLSLLRRYHLQTADIHRHRDLARTACPGDRLPFDAVKAAVQSKLQESH